MGDIRIDVEALLIGGERYWMGISKEDAAFMSRVLEAWRALPEAERGRRERDVNAILRTGRLPAPTWESIAERVARHAWEVWLVAYGTEAQSTAAEEAGWALYAHRWCDGEPNDRDDDHAMRAARLAARALAEALGYRFDGAPAVADPLLAIKEADDAHRLAMARAVVVAIRDGTNADVVNALLAFKAAP